MPCLSGAPDHPRATLVQNAYQELRKRWAAEQAYWDAEYELEEECELEWQAEREERDDFRLWCSTIGQLYDVEDELSGYRLDLRPQMGSFA